MAAFQGSLSESVKRKSITKQNFNLGIKYLIWLIFVSAPVMLIAVFAIGSSNIENATGSSKSLVEFTNDANAVAIGILAVLIIAYGILLYNTIRYLLFPCTKKDLAREVNFKCLINEKGVKYQYNGINRFVPLKQIKRIYDEDEYLEVTSKKMKRGFIIQKDCCFEGSIDEVKSLFNKKLSKHRQTSKAKNDSNYLYALIGVIISVLLAVFAKEIFTFISGLIIIAIDTIIEGFLMPVSSYFFTWLTPTDSVLANLVIDGLFLLWIVIAIIATIWLAVLLPTVFLLLLIIPSLVSASLILPLKQLTVNKKPLSYIAVIVAILCIVVAALRIMGIF